MIVRIIKKFHRTVKIQYAFILFNIVNKFLDEFTVSLQHMLFMDFNGTLEVLSTIKDVQQRYLALDKKHSCSGASQETKLYSLVLGSCECDVRKIIQLSKMQQFPIN